MMHVVIKWCEKNVISKCRKIVVHMIISDLSLSSGWVKS